MASLISTNPSDRTGHFGHPYRGVSVPSVSPSRLGQRTFRTNVRFVRFVRSYRRNEHE
jgi:hypothetical protein